MTWLIEGLFVGRLRLSHQLDSPARFDSDSDGTLLPSHLRCLQHRLLSGYTALHANRFRRIPAGSEFGAHARKSNTISFIFICLYIIVLFFLILKGFWSIWFVPIARLCGLYSQSSDSRAVWYPLPFSPYGCWRSRFNCYGNSHYNWLVHWTIVIQQCICIIVI